jgi:hypothetical protein
MDGWMDDSIDAMTFELYVFSTTNRIPFNAIVYSVYKSSVALLKPGNLILCGLLCNLHDGEMLMGFFCVILLPDTSKEESKEEQERKGGSKERRRSCRLKPRALEVFTYA